MCLCHQSGLSLPLMFIMILHRTYTSPIHISLAIIPSFIRLSPLFCLFFLFWAARVFDVCWAREQGIGYTPQTGNEKFKQIDPCLSALQRIERNSQGGMQIDRARADSGGCEIDTPHVIKSVVNTWGEKVVVYCMRVRENREEEHPGYDIYRRWPPQTLLCIAQWHHPSYGAVQSDSKLPFNYTCHTVSQLSVHIASYFSQQKLLSVYFRLRRTPTVHLGVRLGSISVCLFHLKITPALWTDSASHPHPTVVLMC